MKKLIIILFLVLFCFSVQAGELKDFLTQSAKYDGQKVTFIAEVIGEILSADQGYWINVSADGYSLGVFSADRALFETLTIFGAYKITGDTVSLNGTFFSRCPQHGISCIHGESLKVLSPGIAHNETVSETKKRTVYILGMICLIVLIIYLIKGRSGKRS
jgi:hypothetical protein